MAPPRHRCRREYGIRRTGQIGTVAGTAYRGAGPTIRALQGGRCLDPDMGRYRPSPPDQKAVDTAYGRRRGPGDAPTQL